MYIKYRSIKTNDINIVNVNFSNCKEIYVNDNYIVINMEEETETVKILLDSNESAKLAQEKIFVTLGLKAPQNNVLDLTKLNILESTEMVGLTLQDIADKFKLDIRELAIVGVKTSEKIEQQKIELNEEEGEV